MRFLVTSEQHAHFRKNGHVEFEALFSESDVAALTKFKGERDLMRASESVKKLALHPKLVTIVEQLLGKRRLRYGFDQLYHLPLSAPITGTLKENSSIQGVVIGMMIGVEGTSGLEPNSATANPLFPQAPGNVIFFSPEFVWPQEALQPEVPHPQKCWLVVYADERSQYILQEKDPHTHLLKKQGYGFGDHLKEEHHPLIIK
ncbi:MAG TPA: hypothetical protein VN457_02490 [Chlamydiales bacterium]|nr:hypothetical protein [Chlamydiales bacterium]